jgi:hypothetical protein
VDREGGKRLLNNDGLAAISFSRSSSPLHPVASAHACSHAAPTVTTHHSRLPSFPLFHTFLPSCRRTCTAALANAVMQGEAESAAAQRASRNSI